ncbi:hypothetical protein [Sorangium sp. So ce1151]|uniref:hypothetical protein n=1 Tax=Sorangium sp. So ce1151 TaxID=3133332 RepID=UPI003F5ED3F9
MNLALCGLAVAAFVACGDDGGEGSGGAGGGTGATTGSGGATSASSGTTDPSTTTSSTSASTTSATTGSGGGDVTVPTNIEWIDDFEDGDNAIIAAGNRAGFWYAYNDGSAEGMQTPPADPDGTGDPLTPETLSPARNQSTMALHTFGSGFATWGAGVGVDLSSDEGVKSAYDASAYTGMVFWAKLGSADAATSMTVLISDGSTTPEGGVCDPADDTKQCYDNWAKTISLTTDWQPVVIPFETLKQGGWGATPATTSIDTSALYSLQFQTGAATTFDLYIDDVGFYTEQ